MSLLGRAVRSVRHEARDIWAAFEDPNRIPPNSMLGPSYSGVNVNDRSAMQQSTVWSCVTLIADTVAQLPVNAFADDAAGICREVEPDPPLIMQPHPEMSRQDWMQRLMVSLLMRGNGYLWASDLDRFGFPRSLLPVHPDAVRAQRIGVEPGTRAGVNGRIEYHVIGLGDTLAYPAGNMVHIRGYTWPGWVGGLSVVEYARHSIGLALATEEFGSRLFAEGATPSSVLQTDATLNKQQADDLKTRWIEAHGNRHREPAVLSGGVKWQPITMTPDDSQFLDTRKFQRSEIVGWFHVPPHLVGDVDKTTSWGTGIEEQTHSYIAFAVMPWLIKLQNALNPLIPRRQYVKFKPDALLRSRTLDRFQAYLYARNGSWLTPNEIRALEDRAPLDGGDELLQPLNMGPLGSMGAPPALPAAGAPVNPDGAAGDGAGTQYTNAADLAGEAAMIEAALLRDNDTLATRQRYETEMRAKERRIAELRAEIGRLRGTRQVRVIRDPSGFASALEVGHQNGDG